jgi:hypothetical protein
MRCSGFGLFVIALLGMASVAPGCGGSNGSGAENATQTSAPIKKGDPRPRVEGRWRVLFTPTDQESNPERVVWRTSPRCPFGACSFRVKSSSGSKRRFRFDKAIGDYFFYKTASTDCGYEVGHKVTAKGAYQTRLSDTLRVTDSIDTPDGTLYAARMKGKEVQRSLLRPSQPPQCQQTTIYRGHIDAVRIDPPKGKPGSTAQGATGASGG